MSEPRTINEILLDHPPEETLVILVSGNGSRLGYHGYHEDYARGLRFVSDDTVFVTTGMGQHPTTQPSKTKVEA